MKRTGRRSRIRLLIFLLLIVKILHSSNGYQNANPLNKKHLLVTVENVSSFLKGFFTLFSLRIVLISCFKIASVSSIFYNWTKFFWTCHWVFGFIGCSFWLAFKKIRIWVTHNYYSNYHLHNDLKSILNQVYDDTVG